MSRTVVSSRWRMGVMLALCGVIVALLSAVAHQISLVVEEWNPLVGTALEVALMSVMTSVVLWLVVLRPLLEANERERAAADQRQALLEANAGHQRFEAEMHLALEMATTQDRAFRAARKALRLLPNVPGAVLLMADSSEAHLHKVMTMAEDGPPACAVTTPHDCPAVRRSQTLTFRSSGALDACPYLEESAETGHGAVCVPINVVGRSIGVLHVSTSPGRALDAETVARAETVATLTGSRVGMLRVMSDTTLQASTDPLTGLLNRRSFENRMRALMARPGTFCLAMADLDHFKRLNDTYGHDTGDRALRAFSGTLRQVLRADDIVCRYGGEEFVIVFPNTSVDAVLDALGRVRAALQDVVAGGGVPAFTATFGFVHAESGRTLDEVLQDADANLFLAKRSGRDRIVGPSAAVLGPHAVLVPQQHDAHAGEPHDLQQPEPDR